MKSIPSCPAPDPGVAVVEVVEVGEDPPVVPLGELPELPPLLAASTIGALASLMSRLETAAKTLNPSPIPVVLLAVIGSTNLPLVQ